VQNLNTFKEKQIVDFTQYREKLEGMIKSITTQLEQNDRSSKNYINKLLETTEVNLRNEIELINKRIGEMRLENHKYAFDLQKSAGELNVEHEKMLNIKKDIINNLDNTVIKMENLNKDTVKEFEAQKAEYDRIKSKFGELSEFIKDIRFRKNAALEMDRREVKNFATKMADFQNANTGVRGNKRASTIITKYMTIDDLDKNNNSDFNEADSPRKNFLDNTKHIDPLDLDNKDKVIRETDDGHEVTQHSSDDKEKGAKYNSAMELIKIDPNMSKENDLQIKSGSKFRNKFPNTERRQDTREKESPVRGSVVQTQNNDITHAQVPTINNIKYEVSRKTIELEKRIIEIEHNAKKKLEELTAQLKIYIPSINFNPYVKRTEKNEKLPQVNVENLIYNDNGGQSFSLNIMDPNAMLANTVFSTSGTKKFLPSQKKSGTSQQPSNNYNMMNMNMGLNMNNNYYPNNNNANILQSNKTGETRPLSKGLK
jgi:hypothetical protein